MAVREFDITIGKDGGVEMHCKGFKGSSCLEAVKIFEKMAGEMKAHQPAAGFAEGEIPPQNPPKNVGYSGQTLL